MSLLRFCSSRYRLGNRKYKDTSSDLKTRPNILLGTDLLSEVAVLLALTVTSHKPIVMTGAILPHKAFGADGPGNILAAVRTAATKGWSSEGHEVVIVIQNKIMAPWGTKKENNEFLPGPRSFRGDIKDFRPFFRWLPAPALL